MGEMNNPVVYPYDEPIARTREEFEAYKSEVEAGKIKPCKMFETDDGGWGCEGTCWSPQTCSAEMNYDPDYGWEFWCQCIDFKAIPALFEQGKVLSKDWPQPPKRFIPPKRG